MSSLSLINTNSHPVYWSREEITNALEFLESQQDFFLNQFTNLLNEYHGWDKSPRYYDLLCGEWLMGFTHVIYAAYLEVIRGAHFEFNLFPLPTYVDNADFINYAKGSLSFNQRLRSLILGVLQKGRSFDFSYEKNEVSYGSLPSSFDKMKRVIPNLPDLMIQQVGRAHAPFVFCYSNIKCPKLQWFKALGKWRRWARQERYLYPIAIQSEVNSSWRCARSKSISVASFQDVFLALLPLFIPIVYMEGLKSYRRQVHDLKLVRPKAVCTNTALQSNLLFKTLVADWSNEGTKIFNQQHGGGYGVGLIEPNENYEIRVSDCFYTAGWKTTSSKVKPLCIPFITPCYSSNDRVLLNILTMPLYVFRIQFAGMPGNNEKMLDKTVDFVGALKGKQDLVVRLYHKDNGRNMMERLYKANPNIRLDDVRVSGVNSFADSALVVHNYLGTSWLETLAMNIPTVCFYDRDTYAFREEAQPFMNFLAEVGVLYTDSKEAARHVLSVAENPFDWWNRTEVQEARKLFVESYANYTSNWVDQWEAEFRQCLE